MNGIEIETTIRWSRDPADKLAHVWTNDPTIIRQMDRRVTAYPEAYRVECRRDDGVRYSCPIDRIRFAAPPSEARKLAGKMAGLRLTRNRRKNPTNTYGFPDAQGDNE